MADIVVIGGGVTGLSAGIHLLEEDGQHRVTICEAHTRPGGELTGWDRGAYHIDNCIHWLNGTSPSTRLYREWVKLGALGEDVTIRQRESLYTCRIGRDELTLWRDLSRVERAMLWYAPREEREIRRLIRAVYALQRLSGLDPASGRGGSTVDLVRYARMTTGELADRFRHPLLRQFLTAICDRDFAALAQLEIMAHFCAGNADLPAGGSTAMADRIAARFRSLGGILRLGARVEQIEWEHTEEGVSRHACAVYARWGERRLRIPADLVIVTADPAVACKQLLGMPLPPSLRDRYRAARQVDTAGKQGQRFSAVQAAFVCPRKRLTFTGDLSLPFPAMRTSCPHTGSVLLREFSHEPDFAPAGETVVQVMTFCGEPDARRILAMSKPDYAAFRQEVGRVMMHILESACPPLKGAAELRLLDVWTPATYRRFTGCEIGSFMSFTLTPHALLRDGLSGALSKIHLRPDPGRIPGVDNVLLAGQWLHAPGGLPIAAGEGERAARVATKLLRERDRVRVELSRRVREGI